MKTLPNAFCATSHILYPVYSGDGHIFINDKKHILDSRAKHFKNLLSKVNSINLSAINE